MSIQDVFNKAVAEQLGIDLNNLKDQDVFNKAMAEKLGIDLNNLKDQLAHRGELRDFDLSKYPDLPPYQIRVIEDYKRVATDCLKLDEFIQSEVFYTVNNDERLRLFDQRVHMRRYASVLLDRIDAFLAAT